MSGRYLCLLLGLGCAQTTSRPQAAPSNASEGTVVDQVFATRYTLDYRHPLQEKWFHDAVPLPDLAERCHEGDPDACLQSTMDGKVAGATISYIMRNCRSGHDLSCRYEEWEKTGYKEPYPFELSPAELRRGCAVGIAPECDVLVASRVVDDARFGAEMSCLLAKRDCIRAAQSYLHDEPRSKLRAQYYLEVDCQTYGGQACLLLSKVYRSGELDEPVPGRGDALERYVCIYDDELCPAGKRPAPN